MQAPRTSELTKGGVHDSLQTTTRTGGSRFVGVLLNPQITGQVFPQEHQAPRECKVVRKHTPFPKGPETPKQRNGGRTPNGPVSSKTLVVILFLQCQIQLRTRNQNFEQCLVCCVRQGFRNNLNVTLNLPFGRGGGTLSSV